LDVLADNRDTLILYCVCHIPRGSRFSRFFQLAQPSMQTTMENSETETTRASLVIAQIQ